MQDVPKNIAYDSEESFLILNVVAMTKNLIPIIMK